MSKYKMVSYLFILLGVIVFAGTAYLLISYASDILGAIVDFVTTNDYTKLQQCGVTPPTEFNKLKNEFATIILPGLYLGPIALFVVLSAIMFMAGMYYQRGKVEDDMDRHEKLEREMVHKIVNKMDQDRPSGGTQQSSTMQSKKRRVVEKVVEEDPSGRYREVQTEEETREGNQTDDEESEEYEEPPPRKRR